VLKRLLYPTSRAALIRGCNCIQISHKGLVLPITESFRNVTPVVGEGLLCLWVSCVTVKQMTVLLSSCHMGTHPYLYQHFQKVLIVSKRISMMNVEVLRRDTVQNINQYSRDQSPNGGHYSQLLKHHVRPTYLRQWALSSIAE
jgi:hypothetical protein